MRPGTALLRALGAGGTPPAVVTTWNPADKDATIALSNGNLTATKTSGSDRGLRAVSSKSSGKWCLPVLIDSLTTPAIDIGLAKAAATLGSYLGVDSAGWGYDSANGKVYHSNAGSSYGTTFGPGDVVEILYDADAGELRFTKNGTIQNGGAAAVSGLSGPLFPAVSIPTTGNGVTIQNTRSSYAVSNGYSLWN